MLLYLDTSALIKLYVDEDHHEAVREAADAASRVFTSAVAYAESRAGLARRWRLGDFTEEEHELMVSGLDRDWRTYARLNVTAGLTLYAGELAQRHALRGFDAVHLASALRFADRFENLSFLAFDRDLNAGARNSGLIIYAAS